MPKAAHAARKPNKNLLTESRQRAGLSKSSAAAMLYIDRRKLVYYESTVPPADVILLMSEAYHDPTLPERYCSELCPIGIRCHVPVEARDLAGAVLGILAEYEDVHEIRNRLIEIAEDGTIDESERTDFDRVMVELLDLQRRIESLRLWAETHLNQRERGEAA